MLVAPVSVGDEAMTGSGSVITKDVPATDLALSRSAQINKAGVGRKLFDLLKKKKQKLTLESK
jgi:bifunctional UDP-N-acetylglucosamine pyrophosphorylase/glucosamine-1-phosphate N-acetyltransferase